MTYNPSEDLKKYLSECEIHSYRLVDGSYVIAEEVDRDEHYNVLYLAGALELCFEEGRAFLKPWLDSEEDEFVQVSGDKIVGTTDTPFHLKMHYHRYFIVEKLHNVLTPGEMKSVLKQMFNPPVDNQDLTEDEYEEGEDWKVDNGMDNTEGLKEDKGFKSISDFHTEWRRRHNGNN